MILRAWAIVNSEGLYWYSSGKGRYSNRGWYSEHALVFWSTSDAERAQRFHALGGKVVELAIMRAVKGGEGAEDQGT